MEHLARRCATVAAAALAVTGLVTALTPTTPSLPDIQIRDFGLAAANVDGGALVDVAENHVRADLIGNGEVDTQHITLGDLLFDRGDGDLNAGSSFNIGELDSELSALLNGSGGFDPQSVLSVAPPDIDISGVAPSTTAGVFGGSEQAIGAAAASAVTGIAVALPEAYQAFIAAVAAVEADLNSSLVAAQVAAAERLFGDNPEVNDVVNWIFAVNNSLLAQNESLFNNLFGIPFDAHSSLLGHLDGGLADADWSILLGLTPDEFNEIVNALQADNISLLGSIDWAELFANLF